MLVVTEPARYHERSVSSPVAVGRDSLRLEWTASGGSQAAKNTGISGEFYRKKCKVNIFHEESKRGPDDRPTCLWDILCQFLVVFYLKIMNKLKIIDHYPRLRCHEKF